MSSAALLAQDKKFSLQLTLVMFEKQSECMGGGGWGELVSDGAELERQECRRIQHTGTALPSALGKSLTD